MNRLLVLFSLVATATAFPRLLGGRYSPRIIGGEDALPHEFPYQASLFFFSSHFCGATILNPNTVLTAAHCVDIPSMTDDKWSVLAGKHIMAADEPSQQLRQVSARIFHPGYPGATVFTNDIAIVKLAEPLEFNDDVGSVSLPPAGHTATGEATILGWGVTVVNESYADTLQKAVVPIVTDQACRESYGNDMIDDSVICGGFPEGGKDTCQGDSGGPLLANDLGNGYYLAGVTSGGSGCALPGFPGIYVEVSYFIDFIEANLN